MSKDIFPRFINCAVIFLWIFSSCSIGHSHEKILFSKSTFYSFSGKPKKDEFKLLIKGDSIYTGEAYFTIREFDKSCIFSDSFPAAELLLDIYDTEVTRQQAEDTIVKRATHFFDSENFHSPAFRNGDSIFLDEGSDEQAIAELQKNTAAVSFVYSQGYEGTYYVAYIPRRHKALIFMSHD